MMEMTLFSMISFNSEDPSEVLEAINNALDAGLWLKPKDLLPAPILEFVKEVDHIALSADIGTLPIILQYQKEQGYSLDSFKSTIATKEFGNPITIYELKGGSLPLEIMVPIDNSKKYPPPHIAFSIHHENDLKKIMSLFNAPIEPPLFMKSVMKNRQQNISTIYLDGSWIRLEFICRNPSNHKNGSSRFEYK